MYILVRVYTLRYYSMHDSFYTKLITKIYRSLTNSLSHFSLAASILFQTQVHNRSLRNIYIAEKYPNLSFVISILTSSIDSPSRKESYYPTLKNLDENYSNF